MYSRYLTYKGRVIGELEEGVVWPYLNDLGLQDLLGNMPVRDKIHIKANAPDVLRLVNDLDIPEDAYLSNEELAIYCADRGYRNLTELYHRDHRAWKIIRNREGLTKEIFDSVDEKLRDKRKSMKKKK